nr:PREDICTED: uncharacterized protein LOC109039531 isoform X1 [Bemisia tabaci]
MRKNDDAFLLPTVQHQINFRSSFLSFDKKILSLKHPREYRSLLPEAAFYSRQLLEHLCFLCIMDSATSFTGLPRNQCNPYLRFIRQPPEKANIWKPPEVITEQAVLKMPLMERGLYVSNMIASKFCAWLRSLGTDNSTSSINEEVLKELFEIQLENPTSTGIETRIKELPFLPDVISDAENIPQRSFRALHRLNILMDAKTAGNSNDRRKVSAGSTKRGWKFSKSQAKEKYVPSGIVPEDIAKFEYKFFDDPPIQPEC